MNLREQFEMPQMAVKIGQRLKQVKYASLAYKIFRFFLLIGISFVFLYPVIYMISSAVRPPESVNDPSIIWVPKEVTLESFQKAAEALHFKDSVMVTITLDVISAVLQMISCAFVGYGFARFRFKEKNILFALVIFTIIVPPQTTMMASFANFRFFDFLGISHVIEWITGQSATVNLLNTNLTFYLPALFGMGIKSGLIIVIFRQFFRGMPRELEESAKIDGCGSLQTFFKIIIPNAGAVFLTVFLFSIVWYWNDYYLSAMYFSENYPLSVSLSQLRSGLENINIVSSLLFSTDELRTYIQAGALLTISPLLIMYIVLQRFFTESIDRCGIVG